MIDDIKCANITITNNATLTISANIFQNPRYEFTVESGSSLVVSSGVLETGILYVEAGAMLETYSGAELIIADDL
ncbi:MAG: hypothetical protein ABFS10_04595 [Bacteroidota bacterium]